MALDTSSLRPLDTSGLRPASRADNDFDTSGLKPLDTSGLTPVQPPKEDGPGAISRGFVTGLMQQNPELTAETMEGLSHLSPEEFRPIFDDASRGLRNISKLSPEEYAPRSESLWESESLGEAMTWAGEAFGQGLSSTVPSLITGTTGGFIGGRVAKRPGAVVGALGGASVPSAALNYGEVYRALKDEGVAPEQASEYALYAAGPMVALDVASLGPIITRLGGVNKVRQQTARRIARRIAEESAKGAGREGITEAAQETVKEATVSLAADKPFWTLETLGQVGESGIAGAMVGGALGGGAGVRSDRAPDAVSEQQVQDQPGVSDLPEGASPAETLIGRPEAEPTGEREKAVSQTPPPSPEDIASPIPTDLIQQGRETVQDATGAHSASRILEDAGFPPVESRVKFTTLDGREVLATVIDAFDDGGRQGARLFLEDGQTVSGTFEELRGRVTPVQEESVEADTREAQGVEGQIDTTGLVPAETLPEGWTEASPGGLATNEDPRTGGIVDKQDVSGQWFAVPHLEGAEPLTGFGSRAEAIAALQQLGATGVRPVDRSQRARERMEKSRRIDPERDDIITAIRKLGGIDTDLESDWRGRLSHLDVNNRTFALPRIERPGRGMTLDQLTEELAQYGYVNQAQNAYDQSELAELLDRAESGEPVFGQASGRKFREEQRRQQEESQAEVAREDEEARQRKVEETGGTPEPPYESEFEPVGSGFALDEAEYEADWNAETRTIMEWFEEASTYDPDMAEDILASGANDATVARRLVEVVENGREQQRETESQGQRRQGAQPSPEESTPRTQGQAPAEGVGDLFGQDTRSAQQLADEQRRRDERRSPGTDVSPDEGGGLFSAETRQRDIEDAATPQSPRQEGERDLSARPDLGPTFGDPQGPTQEAAVLRSAQQGRRTTKEPLSGDWKWLLRNEYATEGRGGRLTLTEKGRQRLAELGNEGRRDETQRDIYDTRIEDMEPAELRSYIEELRTAALTDERTGLGSNKAWLRRQPKAFVASIDLDSLKWVNDNLGHEAGDRMIAAMGEALRNAGLGEDAFHISGDEFYVQADDAQTLQEALQAARDDLRTTTLAGEGIAYRGPAFSYGIGNTIKQAEAKLHEDKESRQQSGERAARGERPRGVSEPAQAPEQEPAEGDRAQTPEDRQGQRAERPEPDVETPAQRRKRREERARQQARDSIGAKEGDTITLSDDVGYSSPGTAYLIRRIDGQGTVYVEAPDGGRTSWSRGELVGAQRRGVVFTKVEPSTAGPGVAETAAADTEQFFGNAEAGDIVNEGRHRIIGNFNLKRDAEKAAAASDSYRVVGYQKGKYENGWVVQELVQDAKPVFQNWRKIGTANAVESTTRTGRYRATAIGDSSVTVVDTETGLSAQAQLEGRGREEVASDLAAKIANRQEREGDAPGGGQQIEDFGEKIEGARKDTFAGFRNALTDDVDVAAEPLSKSFPQPNYAKLTEEGVSKSVLAHIAVMRDMIPNKPRKGFKVKQWAEKVSLLRDFSQRLLNGDLNIEEINRFFLDDFKLRNVALTAKAIEDIAPENLPKAAKYRVSSAAFSMLAGEQFSPAKTFWYLEGPNGRAMRNPLGNETSREGTYRETPEEALELAKKIIAQEVNKEQAEKPKKSKYTKISLYRDRVTRETFIGFKVRSTVIRVKSGFEDASAAMNYVQENRDEIQQTIDEMRRGPTMRGTENRPRSGEELREGDVTPEMFTQAFGFRGVQFGNYVEGPRRQADLNRAYDALMDLADVLSIPPKALSLNGSLGLAFGARGRGGRNAAAAHYEPGVVVINLTKGGGPGSLAHEWLHALDNYFARQDDAGGYMSERRRESGPVRDEVYQAWKEVEASLESNSFSKRSAEFDKPRSKPYWDTMIEKAARSFERYIIDRLSRQGVVNDYLANIDTEGGAYPTADEMQTLGIRAAYDKLFNTIETRETERGVEMFSLRDDFIRNINPVTSELKKRLRDLGISDKVALNLRDTIEAVSDGTAVEADGRYLRGIIEVSLSSPDALRALNHEVVHALRDFGLFRGAEWSTLSRAARADSERMQRVREGYEKIYSELGKAELQDRIVEEVVAGMYSDWASGQGPTRQGFIRRAFERMRDFFSAVGRSLSGQGYNTVESIFRSIERGDVGRRRPRSEQGLSQTEPSFALRPGDFSPETAAAIRRSKGMNDIPGGAFTDGFSEVSETVVDLVRQKLQDKFIDLKRLQEATGAVPDRMDAYLTEELYHGKAQVAIEEARETTMKPLLDAIRESGLTIEEAGEYLYARHAKERNARIQEINPSFREDLAQEGGGSGMTDAQADAILRKHKGDSKIGRIGEIVDEITAKHRNLLVSSGLEKSETIAAWEQMYEHYVPLKGREGETEGRISPSRGRGFDVRGRTKAATGRRSMAQNIVANLLAQYETDIIRSQKAEVGRALLRFVEAHPDKALWEVDRIEYAGKINPQTGLVEYRPDPSYQLADNVLVVKVEGVDHRITFHGERGARIAAAMKNLGAANSGPFVRALASVNRVLSAVNTSLNPEFVISNLARDLQTAGINLAGTEADAVKGRILKDVPKAWRGIRRSQKGKDSEWSRYFDEFLAAGAKVGWIDAHSDVNRLHSQLAKEIAAHQRKPGDPRRLIRLIGDFVEAENIAVENAVRLSSFVHGRRIGMSEARAASLAKNLTVNFNRKGEYGVLMNSLYLFYNASVQGSVRMFQALRSPKVRKIAGGIVVFAAMIDIANRLLGGEDDDGEPLYDKIPPWVKERNLIIMNPMAEKGYFKIPLPWGYNVFHVIGQQVGEGASAAMGVKRDYDPLDSATTILSAIAGSFNPLGSEATLGQFLSPTITDPIVSLESNLDWAGRPIRPGENPFEKAPTPDSQKYWNSTGEVPRWIASKINDLTGGSEVRPGAIDVSPTTLEYLYEFATGGAGRFMSNVVDAPLKKIVEGEVDTYHIPFVRKVYGEVGPRETQDQFYENLEQVYYADKELKAAQESKDFRAAYRIKREHRAYLNARLRARAVEKRLRHLREERNTIRAQQMSERMRRARLRDVEERMEREMLDFNSYLRERNR